MEKKLSWDEEGEFRYVLIDLIVVEEDESRVRNLHSLMESIEVNGVHTPIRVQQGTNKLISGRRVLEACKRLGRTTVPVIDVACNDQKMELLKIDDNLHHLNLTVLEQGELLNRREEILSEMKLLPPRHRPKKGAKFAEFFTTKDEARAFDMSERTAQERKQIAKNLSADSKDRIRNTPIADNGKGLKGLSKMPVEQQCESLDLYFAAVDKQEVGKPGTTAKQSATILRKAMGTVKRNARISKIVNSSQVPLDEIGGTYPVIYADPPWQYTTDGLPSGGTPESHYETMTFEDICALPVSTLATDDAILFLWTTRPHLVQATKVIEAWGFEYKSYMMWAKDREGNGSYSRENGELLFIGTKGRIPAPKAEDLVAGIIHEPADDKHAKKPDRFYEIIERYYPELNYLELFSRCPREGWAAWGNEIVPVGEKQLPEYWDRHYGKPRMRRVNRRYPSWKLRHRIRELNHVIRSMSPTGVLNEH